MKQHILNVRVSDTLKHTLSKLRIPEHTWGSFVEKFVVLSLNHMMRSAEKCSIDLQKITITEEALQSIFLDIQNEIGKQYHTHYHTNDNRTQVLIQGNNWIDPEKIPEFLDVSLPYDLDLPQGSYLHSRKRGDLSTLTGLPQLGGLIDMPSYSQDEDLSVHPERDEVLDLTFEVLESTDVQPILSHEEYPSHENTMCHIALSPHELHKELSTHDSFDYADSDTADTLNDMMAIPAEENISSCSSGLSLSIDAVGEVSIPEQVVSLPVAQHPKSIGTIPLLLGMLGIICLLSFVAIELWSSFTSSKTTIMSPSVRASFGGAGAKKQRQQKKPSLMKKEVVSQKKLYAPVAQPKQRKAAQNEDPWKGSIESEIW